MNPEPIAGDLVILKGCVALRMVKEVKGGFMLLYEDAHFVEECKSTSTIEAIYRKVWEKKP